MNTLDKTFDSCFDLLKQHAKGSISATDLSKKMETAANELKAIILTTTGNKKHEVSSRVQHKTAGTRLFYYKMFPFGELPFNERYLCQYTFGEVTHHLAMDGMLLRFYTESRESKDCFGSGYGTCTGYFHRDEPEYINVNASLPVAEKIKTIIHETAHAKQLKRDGSISGLDPDIESEALKFEANFFKAMLPSLLIVDAQLNRGY